MVTRARKPKLKATTEAALLASQPAPMPDRKTFLGGSDFAAVLGVSPWHTPVELWKLKTGRTEPRAASPARLRALERGKKLEPYVLAMLLDKLREQGLVVELVARNTYHTDAEYAFLRCEIDFELRVTGTITIAGQFIDLDNELINGDIKTVAGFARRKWGDEETEEVPIEYAAQFMGGLMVCPGQRRFCIVGALIGLDDVGVYWIRRDDETIAAMRPKLVEFWTQHVLTGVAPDPIRFSDIKDLFPIDNDRTVEATPAVVAAVAEKRRLQTEIRMREARCEELDLDIGEYMGEFARLTHGGQQIASHKTQTTMRLDLDALRRQHKHLVALFEVPTKTRVLRLSAKR